jgi:hypothetical protein
MLFKQSKKFFLPDLFFINKKKYRQIWITVEQRKIIQEIANTIFYMLQKSVKVYKTKWEK